MAQIKLIPSTYYLSNTQYLSVSDANNMYANTDSTTYAIVTNTRTSTSSYYIYIRGFNFNDVPSNALVNSITIKLKAYHTGGNTSTIYCYDGTTQISNAGSTTALGTNATVKTFTNTTIDWDTLKNYGSDFGIRINCRRSNRNTTSYVYIYGAEILVDYTPPHIVEIDNHTSVSTEPSANQEIKHGDDFEIKLYTNSVNNLYIADNGADISSEILPVQQQSIDSFIPSELIDSNGTVTDPNNGLTNEASTTYAQTNGKYNYYLLYGFDTSSIPQNVIINSVSCVAKVQHTRNNTNGEVQLYYGSTPKGSVSTFGNTTATINLDCGEWTREELSNIRIRIGNNYNGGTTTYYTRFYGATLSINYYAIVENNPDFYYYIQNISSDHTIEIAYAPIVKQNGQWEKHSKLYKKENNVWVRKYDFEDVFSNGIVYIRK